VYLETFGYRPNTRRDSRPRPNELARYLEEIGQPQIGRHKREEDMKGLEGFGRDDEGEDPGDYVQEHEVETFEDH
jgi:hypothetical protein